MFRGFQMPLKPVTVTHTCSHLSFTTISLSWIQISIRLFSTLFISIFLEVFFHWDSILGPFLLIYQIFIIVLIPYYFFFHTVAWYYFFYWYIPLGFFFQGQLFFLSSLIANRVSCAFEITDYLVVFDLSDNFFDLKMFASA